MVDAIDYEAAVERIMVAARAAEPFAGTALAVHGIVTGARSAEQRRRLNQLDLLAPDGQPVRWAQNLLYKTHLTDRVYGPFLMKRVLERAAGEGVPVYFYGASEETLANLVAKQQAALPGLRVAGAEEGQYRREQPGERDALVARIKASGARIVFVGLGVPRQETFVHTLRDDIGVPLLAVGAAFDYHAGKFDFPPPWVQRRGLEWAWRFAAEPRRLWKRYVLYNPLFLWLLALQAVRLWRPSTEGAPVTGGPIDL